MEQVFYRKRKKVPEGLKVDPIIDMTVLPPKVQEGSGMDGPPLDSALGLDDELSPLRDTLSISDQKKKSSKYI